MDEDLLRIRFVTSRFADLQGLRTLLIVPSCLALFWAQPYLRLLRYAGPGPAAAGPVASVPPFGPLPAAPRLPGRPSRATPTRAAPTS